jgi:hypothetical protein
MSNAYSMENAAWRKRLTDVVNRLTERDFARTTGAAGWTVGGVLGHLAFWDTRALCLLEKWKKDGIGPSAVDTDLFNEAMRPLLNALAPREAARLALESALAVDAAIDGLDATFLARVEAEGKPVRLNRGAHREHHLAQIEKVLG